MTKMFPFITKTLNPLGGECKHNCKYCWAKKLAANYKMQKYTGEARLFPLELNKVFTKDDFVFVCDMTDLFGNWVPHELIEPIVKYANCSDAQFLFLTKNPERYQEFAFNSNCVLGVTIECDMISKVSAAPTVYDRIDYLKRCRRMEYRKMVSVEPIIMFTESFHYTLKESNPEFVAVGYDNYNNNLVEPSLAKTERLIANLEEGGIKVYRKTLREAIPHKKDS